MLREGFSPLLQLLGVLQLHLPPKSYRGYVYRDNGKENGNYCIIAPYRDNGKENGNYCIIGLYRDNGKENGNYYILGFYRESLRLRL